MYQLFHKVLRGHPFGARAPELVRAAIAHLDRFALKSPAQCAAALLTASGAVYVERTKLIAREAVGHAVPAAVLEMLRGLESEAAMIAIVRRAPGEPDRLVLPCGHCRMLLHHHGGSELQIVDLTPNPGPQLTLLSLDDLLPLPDGGPGQPLTGVLDSLPKT